MPSVAPKVSLTISPEVPIIGEPVNLFFTVYDQNGDLNSYGLRWKGYGIVSGPYFVTGSTSSNSFVFTPTSNFPNEFRVEAHDNDGNGTAGDWVAIVAREKPVVVNVVKTPEVPTRVFTAPDAVEVSGHSAADLKVTPGFVDNQWSDYVARYDDLVDAYFRDGFTQGQTVQAFGAAHYENNGKFEGRTVDTNYGSGTAPAGNTPTTAGGALAGILDTLKQYAVPLVGLAAAAYFITRKSK